MGILLTNKMPAHYLSYPGPKEATIEAAVFNARAEPMTHTFYRVPGNQDPNASAVPFDYHHYPYHGPSNGRYTPHNAYEFGYPYRGMDLDRVAGSYHEGTSQVADHRAYYNGKRGHGAHANRDTSRQGAPLRRGNPTVYGMCVYDVPAYPIAPLPALPNHEWARGAKYMNGTVEYGPLTNTVIK